MLTTNFHTDFRMTTHHVKINSCSPKIILTWSLKTLFSSLNVTLSPQTQNFPFQDLKVFCNTGLVPHNINSSSLSRPYQNPSCQNKEDNQDIRTRKTKPTTTKLNSNYLNILFIPYFLLTLLLSSSSSNILTTPQQLKTTCSKHPRAAGRRGSIFLNLPTNKIYSDRQIQQAP